MSWQTRLKKRLAKSKSNLIENILVAVTAVIAIAGGLAIIFFALIFYLCSVMFMTSGSSASSHWGLTTSLIFGFSFYVVVGIIIALIKRNHATKKTQEKGFIGILLNDYDFTESASLRLITLEYAIAQGVLVGIALASIPCAITAGTYFNYVGHPLLQPGWLLTYGVVAFLLLAIIRFILEATALKIRERQSAIRFYIAARDRIANGGQDPNISL